MSLHCLTAVTVIIPNCSSGNDKEDLKVCLLMVRPHCQGRPTPTLTRNASQFLPAASACDSDFKFPGLSGQLELEGADS